MSPSRCAATITLLLVLSGGLAGCLGGDTPNTSDPDPMQEAGYTSVRDRHLEPFVVDGEFSKVLEPGPYAILPAQDVFVDFALPLGAGVPSAQVNLGLFMPDVPAGTKVPVVADVGPYYDGLLWDTDVTVPAERLGRFLIENLVPHGFAVAQVSVPGTGRSGGCMDLMGPVEQAGIKAAMDWLGKEEWSNGDIGLTGRSYDGSTPWEAAMDGNPHVKTVVPISGLWGQHELMWRNGTAENRGPGVLWGLYYTFPLTPKPTDVAGHPQRLAEHMLCPGAQMGGAQGVAAYLTGDQVAPALNTYWTDRSFRTRMLDNYEGSVYFIHGMQDWNVDPHMAFPFYNELDAKGLEMKGLFGQWGHHYPDRSAEHDHLRWDWAQDLLEWFTYTLKEEGPRPELHVEMQDDSGRWRIEETWPPADVEWTLLRAGEDWAEGDGSVLITPASGETGQGTAQWVEVATFDHDVIIAGLPRFHVEVTPAGAGGQLYLELRDSDDNDRRLGHAIMDLRFRDGGWEAQPVVPGERVTAKMEFFPMDATLPAGHRLGLYIAATGRDYTPSPLGAPVMVHLDGGTVLKLPVIERGEDDFFTPPGTA